MYAIGFGAANQLTVFTILICAFASLAYITSRFRNYVALHTDRVSISVWVVLPVGTHHLPYDRITRVETDDSSGKLSIWFKDNAGNPSATEIFLNQPSFASKIRDAIVLKHPGSGMSREDSQTVGAIAVSPDDLLPSHPDDKSSQRVDSPGWMKWGLPAGALLVAFAAVVWDGAVNLEGLLVAFVFSFLLVSFFAAMLKFQNYLILHPGRVDMRYALEDRHRIKYADVVDAQGSESGWLIVTYTKKATLGFGGGETEAGIRIKPHSLAPVVAEAIRLARDRARHGV